MRYYVDAGILTLQAALFDHMNSEDLRKLGALTKQKLPTRKGDLAAVILQHLEGDRLQTVWRTLDELQRAAVADSRAARAKRNLRITASSFSSNRATPIRRSVDEGRIRSTRAAVRHAKIRSASNPLA